MEFIESRRRLYQRDLADRNGCTPRTIHNRVKNGRLPQPRRDELNRWFWWSDEIAEHEASLQTESV